MRVFFFNDTATTEIYTLSLHDALPISQPQVGGDARPMVRPADLARYAGPPGPETERVPEAAPGLRPLRRQLGRERDRQRTSEHDGQTGHGSKSLLRRGVPS